jgi:hypothetical protein
MTEEQFAAYLGSLPPEVRLALADGLAPVRAFAARTAHARDLLAREFPKVAPPLRAVISLALARYR